MLSCSLVAGQKSQDSGTALILEWGKHGTQWAIGSWYCNPGRSNCYEGGYYTTSVGKTITETLTGSNCNSNAACSWSITTSDGSNTPPQSYTSSAGMYWVDAGILEVYNVDSCSKYPARGTTPTEFNSYSITDTTGRSILPGWTGYVSINDLCNENVVIGSGSSYSDLYYGPK